MSPFRAEPVRGQQQKVKNKTRVQQSKEQKTQQTALCWMVFYKKNKLYRNHYEDKDPDN